MGLDLVIGHKNEDHITATDMASLLKDIFADTNQILRMPSVSASVSQGESITLHISDGSYSMQGRYMYDASASTLTVAPVSTAGKYRKDSLIAQFTRVNSVESVEYQVVVGTESNTEDGATPPTTSDDLGSPETRSSYKMLIGFIASSYTESEFIPRDAIVGSNRLQHEQTQNLLTQSRRYKELFLNSIVKNSLIYSNYPAYRNSGFLAGVSKNIDLSCSIRTGLIEVSASLRVVDDIGKIYPLPLPNNVSFQAATDTSAPRYYMLMCEAVLDIEKLYKYREDNTANQNFPIDSAGLKLLVPTSPFLGHDNTSISINSAISGGSALKLFEAHVSYTNPGKLEGKATILIPLLYFKVYDDNDGSGYGNIVRIYDLSNPELGFREKETYTRQSWTQFNNLTEGQKGEINGKFLGAYGFNQSGNYVPYTITKVATKDYCHDILILVPTGTFTYPNTLNVYYYALTNSSAVSSVISPT